MTNSDYYLITSGKANVLSDGAGKYAAKANRWESSSWETDFSLTPRHNLPESGRCRIFYPSWPRKSNGSGGEV
jgi:hypothetical protein